MFLVLNLLQYKIGYDNIDQGLDKLENILSSFFYKKNSIILLPELWISGFNRKKLFFFTKKSKELRKKLQSICKKYSINLGLTVSRFINKESRKLYNTFILISSEGKILSEYNKLHLFPLTGERDIFCSGKFPTILNFNGVLVGFAICYDIRFPELFRYYARNKVNIVFVSACFPKPRIEDWKTLLRARAIENQYFICAVNAVGKEKINNDKIVYFGKSLLINPRGEILLELGSKEEQKSISINVQNDVINTRKYITYINDIKDVYYK